MPARRLKTQLESLHNALKQTEGPLSEEEREALQQLANDIEAKLEALEKNAQAEADPTLVDGVNLMVEQFSARHPTVAATLRSVVQTLSDMGI